MTEALRFGPVVAELYRRIIADGELAPFFGGVDIAGQTTKMASYLEKLLTNPSNSLLQDLSPAHARLVTAGLSDRHFDRVGEHLKSILDESGVRGPEAQTILDGIESTRGFVLNRIAS